MMALNGQTDARPPQPPPRHPTIPLAQTRRLGDAFHSIQEEYNGVLAERDTLRHELTRMQTLANEQDTELNLIRHAIWSLQNQLENYRQRFEDERCKLFEELRQQRAAAGLSPPSPLRELANPIVPLAQSSSQSATQIPVERMQRNREVSRDRKMKGRAREYVDSERDDYREPKRIKSTDGQRVFSIPSPALPQHPRNQPHVNGGGPPSNGMSGSINQLQVASIPPHTSKTAAPPMSDELTLSSVPPDFRKDINGWTVSFNPKFPRNMDVDMVCSIPHPSVVCSIHFSFDGRYVATGCNQAAYIYDIKTGAQICTLIDPSFPKDGDLYIRSVRFSPDGEFLATGAEDHRVRVWNIKQRTLRYVFAGHTNEIYALDYARNGHFIVSGSADRTARLWDLRGGGSKSKIFKVDAATEDCGITSISISPNNRYVAAGCLDQFIRIWDLDTGDLAAKLRGHQDNVYTVRFMPDGRTLVSGSLDYTVKYWDVSALTPADVQPVLTSCPLIGSVRGHQDYVLTVACSSDSRWVVSGAKDRAVMFWDPNEGLARFKLYGHTNSVISVDIHGPYIATASGDMCCRICRSLDPLEPSHPDGVIRGIFCQR